MMTSTDLSPGHLRSLAHSFDRSLRAEGRAPNTRKSYGEALTQFTDFAEAAGMPVEVARIRREHVEAWIVDLSERWSAATAAIRFRSLARFFRWCVDEGECVESPMAKMRAPKIPEVPVPVVEEDDLRKLLKSCSGKSFADRRDNALIRLLIDCGLRRAEVAGLTVDNVDLKNDVVVVTGKGNKTRVVPFGAKAGTALDRYMRERAKHARAKSPSLWLGPKGALTGSGVAQILEKRCKQAAIVRLHPHQLRHTFAHQWFADGGNEGDLMRLTGWSSRSMLDRYGKSAADRRAIEAHRQHSFGDRL